MTPEVVEAVEEIRKNFSNAAIDTAEDGEGGAFVTIDPVLLGTPYAQKNSWIGFQITHACPFADVYPHFVRHDLSRADEAPLGEGFSKKTFNGREATQISRRTKRQVEATTRTPLLKLLKVLEWLKSR